MKVLVKDVGPFHYHSRLMIVEVIQSLASGEIMIKEVGDSIPTHVTNSRLGHQDIKICDATEIQLALLLDAMQKRDELDRQIREHVIGIVNTGKHATPDTLRMEFMNQESSGTQGMNRLLGKNE